MKATAIVAMSNYLEASSIVAGAGGLSLWIDYLHLNPVEVGILGAVSANGFGSAAGALVGGFLVDRFGRKFVYKHDLLIYMLGVILVAFSVNYLMLLAGYFITGIAVGAGIPAAWTYIAEEAPTQKRAARVGWGQIGVGSISLAVPTLILKIGFKLCGSMMIGFLIIHLIIGFLLAPDTRGKTLHEIEMAWYGTKKEHNPTPTTPLATDKVDETTTPSSV
ncbi:unnamed protein product [Rotaria sp. Silwood1]|nr:unnamed protein product [Rotaria sp. Silwood1]